MDYRSNPEQFSHMRQDESLRPTEWASILGGSMLLLWGLRRTSLLGLGTIYLGGNLIYRAIRGTLPPFETIRERLAEFGGAQEGIHVEKSVRISRPVDEVYRFWRNFENFPRFMKHVESIDVLDERRSHWRVKGPAGSSVEWDAEIIEEQDNQRIVWQSMEGADVPNCGLVEFERTPDGETEVHVMLEYRPPGGRAGAAVSRVMGEEPNQQLEEDLRRFKEMIEAGRAA